MNKFFKLSLLTLCAFALVANVKAQNIRFQPYGVFNTTAVSNLLSTATNVNLNFGPLIQKSITLQIEVQGDAATSTTYGFHYRLGADALGASNTPLNSLLIAFAGTSKQIITTNINLQGNAFFQIPYITNASGTVNGTNIVLKANLNYNAP